MIQFRKGCFETNSSSTHSMVMGLDSDFDKWKKGELLYIGDSYGLDREGKVFVTKEELTELIKAKQEKQKAEKKTYVSFDGFKGTFDDDDMEILRDEEIFATLDDYCEYRGEYLEEDEQIFTTPSGEKVRCLCYYGYDG